MPFMKKIIIFSKSKSRSELLARGFKRLYHVDVTVYQDKVSMLRSVRENSESINGILILDANSNEVCMVEEIRKISTDLMIFDESIQNVDTQIGVTEFFEKIGVVEISGEVSSRYLPVRFYDFMAFSITPCDIFIKMGESNFIKIINKDELYTQELLEHYRNKKIEGLFISKNDCGVYLQELYSFVKDQYRAAASPEDKIKISSIGIDCVHQSIINVGIDKYSIDLALNTVDSVMESFKLKPELFSTVEEFISSKSFLSEHSVAIAIVGCAMARKMKLNSDFIFKKIVFAALFHDIALKDCDQSFIINIESPEYSDLSADEKKEFSCHINDAINFLSKIPGTPSNVESIILEHHERPNGKGYPRGLDSFNVSPLGAVFIVAEDFVHHIFRSNSIVRERDLILAAMSEEYNKGQYKIAMRALLQMFL